MPSTYKTPGVYVEEVSTFPPSVAPVATAIPAFIGYTESAIKNGEKITNVPTKIASFVEFVQYFGGSPERGVVIRLDGQSQFVKTETKSGLRQYYLYDSLRLFYANGGGDCYVVSVGNYTQNPDIGQADSLPYTGILGGLKSLDKFDEPTMIVSPDATLVGTDMYTYQQQALAQCARLQDRFFIGDLLQNDEETAGETFDERVEQIRNTIGINNLKYGALYAPWVKSTLSAGLTFRDVFFQREGDTATATANKSNLLLLGLTSDEELRQLVYDVQAATTAVQTLEDNITPGGSLVSASAKDLAGELKIVLGEAEEVVAALSNASALTDAGTELTALYDKLLSVMAAVNTVYQSLPTLMDSVATASSANTAKFRLAEDIDELLAKIVPTFEALSTQYTETSGSFTLFSSIAALSDFEALFNLLDYAGAVDPVNVDVDATTAATYHTIDAIVALITELNAGALKTALDLEATPADALTLLESEMPADFSGELTTVLTAAISGSANLAALDVTLSAGNLLHRIAKAYVDAQGAADIDSVANSMSSEIDGLVSTILALANATVGTAASTAVFVTGLDQAGADVKIKAQSIINTAKSAISDLTGFYGDAVSAATSYENTFNESLKGSFGLYKSLLDRADSDIMVLPPSGAMAGIYTKVDNERGVWKAPANVSLSSVSAPYVNINAKDQEDLNVDVNAGKSINAIRAFTGKGILVWGARTLAGNDNEWRYVPVRRFFNFAEESIKKATEQFVFEPNDANTWVRVRAMIENFLILQWRAGALAGAKPEQAFFVKIGLGETMTALDILEGRMIVEIGMAVVRPAEFIILRFSHKMQES